MFALSLRLLGFVCVSAFASAAANLDREIVLAPHSGNAREDQEIIRWQERAGRVGANAEAFERLAWAYVTRARLTLDAGFYKLAEKTADVIDAQFGASPESRLLRGHVLHNLHRFKEAELIARRLTVERGLPVDFALLSDALVEQGKIAEGVSALQQMANLKPGVEADSRIAHIRWLKGDLTGAISALEAALSATDKRDIETRAWLLTRLSGLHLQRGATAEALALSDRALEGIDHYPPALLARGRALIALGRTGESTDCLRRAEELQPLPEYQWWLIDALAVSGRDEEAAQVERRLKARGAENDPRTYSLFLATRRDRGSESLRLARAELGERADVLSHDALAWSLVANDHLDAAADEIRLALVEGTKDARLHFHAGEIALARGDRETAKAHFAKATAAALTLTPSERTWLARSAARMNGGLAAQ